MDGFTVKNANRFLSSGSMNYASGDQQFLNLQGFNEIGTGAADFSGRGGDLGLGPVGSKPQLSFADTLNNAISKVNSLQVESDKAIQNLATGKTDNVADVMIASERADIALKLMVQVRNKIIDAYQEIMKMQV